MMNNISRIGLVTIISLLTGVQGHVQEAQAASARADLLTPPDIVGPGPGGVLGTFDICAYSKRTDAPNAAGPNANSVQNLAGITTSPAPACPGNITVGGFLGLFGRVYAPPVGSRGNAKPLAARTDNVTSTSNGVVGFAEHDDAVAGITLEARAFKPSDATGDAAGECTLKTYLSNRNKFKDLSVQ